MDFHLFLSSLDSHQLHPGNTPGDFTVELPQSMELKGMWECALVDFQLIGASVAYDPFCLCTDICEESCVGDTQLPILRRLTLKGQKKDSLVQFINLNYVRVNKDQINRIRIYIKSTKHHNFAVSSGELSCTLHLRIKQ